MWVQVSRVVGKEDFERFEVKDHTKIQNRKQCSNQRGMQSRGVHSLARLNKLRQSLAALSMPLTRSVLEPVPMRKGKAAPKKGSDAMAGRSIVEE